LNSMDSNDTKHAYENQFIERIAMAKRSSTGKSGVIVAQEIKALILANKTIKGPEVMDALREKFPKETFNDKSCQVTYSNLRKNLGLSHTLKRKPVATGRPAAGRPAAGRPAAATRQIGVAAEESSVDMSLLQAAKVLLQHCNGDVTIAVNALQQIASLQMS